MRVRISREGIGLIYASAGVVIGNEYEVYHMDDDGNIIITILWSLPSNAYEIVE